MGVSIFSGFITTFGSGFILLFCQFMTLQKFGSTVCQTVAFSFLVSTFLFGAFMHAVGPQKHETVDPKAKRLKELAEMDATSLPMQPGELRPGIGELKPSSDAISVHSDMSVPSKIDSRRRR